MTEQFTPFINGQEFLNEINEKFYVSFCNPSGATEYNMRFYFSPYTPEDQEPDFYRLSASKGEYKIISAYEDCEVGKVEFQIGHSFYSIDFGHDGDEPFTAHFQEIAKPDGWSYEKTMQYLKLSEDQEEIKEFVADRVSYFKSIHETANAAADAIADYFRCNVFNGYVNLQSRFCT